MYTDEDLNLAVEKGVFSATSVEEFRYFYCDCLCFAVVFIALGTNVD